MIRKGDSLLLTQTGTGSVLEIDPGTGVWENVGAPGDTLEHTYTEAGIYTVCSRIDGGEISSIEVTVVDVNLHNSIACQVGFMRDLDVFVTPVSAKESVDYTENDPRILHVEFNEYTDEGAALKLVPYTRGTPVLVARLGSNGPIVSTQEIDEFTTDIPARESIVVDADVDVGTTELVMRPYIPNLIIDFKMFASTSTFEGGITEFTVSTSDFEQVYDEETDETIGVYEYDIEVPETEDQYCFNIDYSQEMNPTAKIIPVGKDGLINGGPCKARVNQVYMCYKGSCILTITLVKRSIDHDPHDVRIVGGPAPSDAKRPIFKDKGVLYEGLFVCTLEEGHEFKPEIVAPAGGAKPGKYSVKIGKNTTFADRIIVVGVTIREGNLWWPKESKLLATGKHDLQAIGEPEGGSYLWSFEGGKAIFDKETDQQPEIIALKEHTNGYKNVIVEYTYGGITCTAMKPLMITHPLHSRIKDTYAMEGIYPSETTFITQTTDTTPIPIINYNEFHPLLYEILDQENELIYNGDRGNPKESVYAFELEPAVKSGRPNTTLVKLPPEYTPVPAALFPGSILYDKNVVHVNKRYLFYDKNENLNPLQKEALVFRVKHTWMAGVGKENDKTTITEPKKVVGENILEGKVHKLEQPASGGTYTMHIKWTITRVVN